MDGNRDKRPIIKVRNVVKTFGGVQALKGVDLDAYSGEVHGLVGANGAGKSTLIRILAGVHQPDSGQILVENQEVTIQDPQHARQLGFSFIHQELNLVPKFNALQNLTLGLPKESRWGIIDWKATRRDVNEAAERVGIDFPLTTPIEELSVGEQWLVSIAHALVHKSTFIAMDEPTASLSVSESERLFDIIRELSGDGISILYVSHRLDEILEICDWVTVLKDGARILAENIETVNRAKLVSAIVGSEIPEQPAFSQKGALDGHKTPILEVKDLVSGDHVKQASFTLYKGEVLGLGGLVGAGRTELVRLIFGADKPDSGSMVLDGTPWAPRSPYAGVNGGIAFIPEERRAQGIILNKSITFNITLPALEKFRLAKHVPLLNLLQAQKTAQEISARMQVKSDGVNTPVSDLSGGNQQKVVIGKWLTRDMRVLILDEPSRGVDVGARVEIHSIIRRLALEQDVGVILISSEAEELPLVCDRVLVMVEGRIAGELRDEQVTKENILQLSYAHETNSEIDQ